MARSPSRPRTTAAARTLSADELRKIDAYWRAANYLSVGQIYLLDNPLLRKPLRIEHVKPRLLGHWGTTPGLNFIYAHLNRVIVARDLDVIYLAGPGHGGPALVANAYLEGTYAERYHAITEDVEGMQRLFKQFSFPGGIPSHVAPETPGSIHEGGELGYVLAHAYGAAFDNPDLVVAAVVGDGEAETGPLATGWHGNKFLNPARDGAVLPILHLNGYKIANPCYLARIPHDELDEVLRGHGVRAGLRGGPRSGEDAPADGGRARRRGRGDPAHPARRAHEGLQATSRVADDRVALAQRMDVPQGHRRQAVRGLLARAPGADGRHGQARAHADPRTVDEELPAAGALRQVRPPRRGPSQIAAEGHAPHERQPARERRHAAARPAHAGLPELRGQAAKSRRGNGGSDPRDGAVPARRDEGELVGGQFPPVQPR